MFIHSDWSGDLYYDSGTVTFGDNEHSVGLNLNLGYGMSFGQFNLAGELSYQPSMAEAKSYSSNGYSTGGDSYSDSAEFKLTKGMAISILPGYKIGDNTLVYGRLGHVRATASGSDSWSENYDGDFDSGSESYSTKVDGILLGVGMKHAFTPKLSAVLEYQAVNFKKAAGWSEFESWEDGWETSTTAVKPSVNGVLLGIQYAF